MKNDSHPRPWHPLGLAPRDHAHRILAMGKDQRKIEEYVERNVPEQYRQWVAEYIQDWAARERSKAWLRRRR